MQSGGQLCVARGKITPTTGDGFQSPPGNGATITLYDSGADEPSAGAKNRVGAAVKRVIVNVFSSHASAASGLQFDESYDDGANWDNLVSYSISATTPTKNLVAMSAPRIRVRYVNSANVLTAWRMAVLIDGIERSTQ